MLTPADDRFEAGLRAALPAAAFRPLEPRYLEEPRGLSRGADALLIAPATVQEAATAIRAAQAARVPVVPYGGGTGLVGGQIGVDLPRPLVISLERMTAIRATYPAENTLVVEAGAILAHVQQAAHDIDRLFPLSLASEGSARIGGLLSTNAGGVNVLRYGTTRDLVLGVEAVLPDGSVLNGLKRLRKDNTGYDLRHLLIGAEGTLGLITAAALRLMPRPAQQGAAFMVLPDPDAALRLLDLAQRRIGPGLDAFELISGQGLRFQRETMPDLRQPFADVPEWSVLIDLGLPAGVAPEAVLEDLFADAHEAGLVADGVIAQSGAQRDAFWEVRENIPEANRRVGSISSHDISLPLSAVPEFLRQAGAVLGRSGDLRINAFGHLGDGNLHYNVFPAPGRLRADYADRVAEIKRMVFDLVRDFDGSFSAEHGIGRLKVAELEHYGDPTKLTAMRAIKTALDPAGIMNSGAVLRAG
ncbi:MAG: FAD-binding oxidoreductase [Celeribacter sp.]|jgi:FAD/FMN-containing dehydrogenase